MTIRGILQRVKSFAFTVSDPMQSDQVPITGCAVAQHCYNGDVSFLWENGNFDPL